MPASREAWHEGKEPRVLKTSGSQACCQLCSLHPIAALWGGNDRKSHRAGSDWPGHPASGTAS